MEVTEADDSFESDLSEEEIELLVKLSDMGVRHLRSKHCKEAPEAVLFAVLSTFHEARERMNKNV